MKFKTTKLRNAISFALVTGSTALAGVGAAVAQESSSSATTLDRIEVTGSRIRQVEMETAQPVLTISREDIQSGGFNSVADILQNISAAGAPAFSRASPLTSNQEAGGQYIDLRNLGAQRTLVLLNGKRLGISPNGYQDVSTIPAVVVERIDVLKDGASSIYGSDAMAGVINIITRKNFEGAEANVYFGQYGQGDGQKQTYDFMIGMAGDRGSVTIGAEYHNEDEVWARDRYFSADSYPGFPQYSNTVVGQWGNYNRNSQLFRRNSAGVLNRYLVDDDGAYVTDDDGAFILDPINGVIMRSGAAWSAPNRGSNAIGSGNFHPQQNPADTSRASDQMHVLTPLERRSLFVNANYDLTDNIRFVADMGYTKRQSFRQIAGYPTQSTAISAPMAGAVWRTLPDGTREFVSNGSYFNPNGNADLFQADVATELDGSGNAFAQRNNNIDWRRRGWEVPRTTQTDQTTWRFTAALEGSFEIGDRYFDWDAGYMFNENDVQIINNGNFYIPHVRAAVGPSFMNSQGQVVCGTKGQNGAADVVIAGCVPWNPFAGFGTGATANSLDDEAVRKYLFKQEHAIGNTQTNNYFANLAGSLFALPAGDVGFAVGYEHRREQGGFTPDAIAQSGDSTNLASGPTFGSYKLDEFYVELNVPILADLNFAKELSLSVASRYSDFDTFGDTTNNKFGLKWRPIDSLLVRGTWSEGFRAPTIGDLYGGGSQTFTTSFRDPCDSVYGNARGSARCLQDVSAGYRQLQQGFVPTTTAAAQTPVPFTSGSNSSLQPENSESKTIGFVYSPGFVEGLTVALDWWNIYIENTMVSDTPNLILSDCYVSLIESRCAMFSRDPVLQIVNQLNYGLRNAGYTETEGYDLDVSYRLDTEIGQFGVKWATTYVSLYETKATDDADVIPAQNNGFGSYFRVRSNLNLSWNWQNVGVTWGMRYNSGTKEGCFDAEFFPELCSLPDFQAPDTQGSVTPQNRIGSTTFNDLQVSWKAPWNARIAIGANNVLNRQPPVMFSQPDSNFAFYGGHDLGRFIYARYQQKF